MPNYNYYKTISANMLVTTHDLNFVMGFIKEDEIYNPQNGVVGVSERLADLFTIFQEIFCSKLIFFSFLFSGEANFQRAVTVQALGSVVTQVAGRSPNATATEAVVDCGVGRRRVYENHP